MGCLWQAMVRFSRGLFFIVNAKRQIWLTMKSTWQLKALLFPNILRFYYSGKEHSAIMRFWQEEVINRRQGILAGVSTFCTELNCENCRVHSACQTNQRGAFCDYARSILRGAFCDYANLARRGNQQEARHFSRCFDFLYWIKLW